MTNNPFPSARTRAILITRGEGEVLIPRENPIFDYFSSDERADSVLLHDGEISLVGEREVDPEFVGLEGRKFCLASPSFDLRDARRCGSSDKWFEFPLREEKEYIKKKSREIEKIVQSVASSMHTESTESDLSNEIRNEIYRSGFKLYYSPIIAFDSNTNRIWNLADENRLKKVMYVEVAARSMGLTVLYSNTFLATDDGRYLELYRKVMDAAEMLKRSFIEGVTTTQIAREFDKFRRENLYLTSPLFPFLHSPIPGNERVVRTGDVAVFDLWFPSDEFSLRRKIVAVAGSYEASFL